MNYFTLNGQEYPWQQDMLISSIISQFQLDPRQVAIEQNLCIVPPSQYTQTYINSGDVLEVVQFIGGG